MNNKELLKLLELQADLIYRPTIKKTNQTLDYISKNFPDLMDTKNLSDVFDTQASVQHLQGIDDNSTDLKLDKISAEDLKESPYNWFHTGCIAVNSKELVNDIIKITREARDEAQAKA